MSQKEKGILNIQYIVFPIGFIFSLFFGFFLIGISVNVLVITFLIGLDLIAKIVFFLFGLSVLLFSTLYIKLVIKSSRSYYYKKRDIERIKKEKAFLLILVLITWVFVLSTVTLVLYMLVNHFSTLNPEIELYNYVIASGASGAIWGIGISDGVRFYKWAQYGNNYDNSFDLSKKGRIDEWYSEGSFFYNLQKWKERLLIVLTFFALLVFTIIPIMSVFVSK